MFTEINKVIGWFNNWGKLKVQIQLSERVLYFREREVWWASLGANIGFEEYGKNEKYERPVLIIKKFNKDLLWILPLTSKLKVGPHYYVLSNSQLNSSVIFSQLRAISNKRLIRKIGVVLREDFERI